MQDFLGKQLVGSWELQNIVYLDKDEVKKDFWGEAPQGILTYTASGYINVQFMQSGRVDFQNSAFGAGTSNEVVGAFNSYQSYFGTYKEVEPGLLNHYIQGCLFPNWSGQTEIRYATINDDVLKLRTPPTKVKDTVIAVDAIWKRL